MAVFAIVTPSGGVVTNTVVGDSIDYITELVGPCVEVTEATGGASIGDIWDGTTFSRPS